MIMVQIDIHINGNTCGVSLTSSLRGDSPEERQTLREKHPMFVKDVERQLAAFVRTISKEEEGA